MRLLFEIISGFRSCARRLTQGYRGNSFGSVTEKDAP